MTLHFGDWCAEITISNCRSHLLGKEGEGGHPDPEIRGAVSRKCFFSPSGLILILNGVGGGGGGGRGGAGAGLISMSE